MLMPVHARATSVTVSRPPTLPVLVNELPPKKLNVPQSGSAIHISRSISSSLSAMSGPGYVEPHQLLSALHMSLSRVETVGTTATSWSPTATSIGASGTSSKNGAELSDSTLK